MSITLTPLESQIFTILDSYSRSLSTPVECRIAGGWVRDKLLSLASDDIDVALSFLTGLPFALGLQEWCREHGVPCGKTSRIEANPEKSKHLETTKFDILGLEMDFVNLRAEDYAEDSRVPSQRFGTPLEDALRRDLTINALFYNVHTRKVEDFTGKGLADLKNGICRTPLPPRQTFLDDPLRVPRAIRFSARFNFVLDPALREAAALKEVKDALMQKVSRERVGIELEKMLKGPNPLLAIEHIHALTLYEAIYLLPAPFSQSLSSPPLPSQTGLIASSVLSQLLFPPRLRTFQRVQDSQIRKRLFLASELTPYARVTYTEKRPSPAVEAITREGLKLSNHDVTAMSALFAASELLSQPVLSRFPPPERRSIGLVLRNPAVHDPVRGLNWEDSLSFSLVQDLIPYWDLRDKRLKDGAEEVLRAYELFLARLEELGLPAAIEEKPRLDGKEISSTLNIRPGPAIGPILNSVVAWQLEFPEGTKEECRAWLREQVESGGIDLPEEGKGKGKGGGGGGGGGKKGRK
ncbi:hypothetical protein DACRYDRAFT_108237 [Dacryopinax primogenitus]|uniref:Poly A polymerase head domain-containing protein n=1 Tax=Dacryopinax primogenitus (strain DJM 731) TaxID=1858805 RepID=M5G4U7_DACPD|nr:uncharacterized protein DACRYDRAFT_108237 [Dacryopinax primogenitus]EJU00882.1 hypothetical protein DACRYDRAFT_108237 [Dacryopinax primogenitus]